MRRALFFVLALAGAGAARAQTVTIRPAGDLSALVGMPLDVPVVADWSARADKLGSFALTLRWNPAILRYDGGTPGTFGAITTNADSAPQGVLRLSGANPNGVNGVITLGVGRFTPLDTVGTTVQLQVTELYATAPTFADLIGSALPQNALYCAARGLWGDPDVDGNVGSRDALLALSNAVGLDMSAFPNIALADVDTSGTADARDALVILSYAVGMDVSGFRIHKLALGSCGTELQTSYAILPGPDTLVLTQDLHLTLQASASGAIRTLSDVFWHSSDPTVMAVTQDGRAFAVGAGVVTLIGKSGSSDSAVATMTVVARRTHHIVDAAAISAANRIGSATLPFASLSDAARITAEGDTVIMRPGHYADPGFFTQGVVILGQSGGGGVVLSTGGNSAISFDNGRRAEVHNVAIDNSYTGVEAFDVDTLIVDSLTYTAAAGTCVSEAVGTSDIRLLSVRRSLITGDGISGCTSGIDAFGVVQNLVVDGVTFSDLGNDAIYAGTGDSVTVRRSTFHDLGNYAIDVGALRAGQGRLPQPVSLALVVDSSRFTRLGSNSAVSAIDLRSALVMHSAVVGDSGTPVQVTGIGNPGGYARFVNDTLLADGSNDWLDAYALDSVRVDSVTARGYEGYFSNVTSLRATRSNVAVNTSGRGFFFEPFTLGGALVADSVTITGDAACPQCGDGIYSEHAPVTVTHYTASGLNYALQTYDSTVTLTNATISDTYEGLYANSPCCGAAPRAVVRNLTTVNTKYPVEISSMALVGDSMSLSAGYTGVETYGSGPDTLRSSTVADFQYAVDLEGDTVYASANTILRPTNYGIQTYGNSNPIDTAVVTGNAVTCDAAGAVNAIAIYAANGASIVSGNTVTGCGNAVYAYNGNGSFTTTDIRGNVVTAPAAANYAAIYVGLGLMPAVVGNQITGGGHGGAIFVDGYYFQPAPRARVDSNVVRHVSDRGIWVSYADTLVARGNLIDTVTNTGYWGSGPVGIALVNGGQFDSLVHNTIRHASRGVEININGVLAALDSNAISATDSAAVWVDAGQVALTGNHIANNLGSGLNIPNISGLVYQVHGNAFVNDALYGVAVAFDSVDAQNNWWGVAGGANLGGDSISGRIDATNPTGSDPTGGLPPLAPPVRIVAARAPAPSSVLPPRRTFAAPVRVTRPVAAGVTTNARLSALADRMAAAGGGSHVARAVTQRADRLRVHLQADLVRAQDRAQRAAAQLERERQAEAARAARVARLTAQKGRTGQ